MPNNREKNASFLILGATRMYHPPIQKKTKSLLEAHDKGIERRKLKLTCTTPCLPNKTRVVWPLDKVPAPLSSCPSKVT